MSCARRAAPPAGAKRPADAAGASPAAKKSKQEGQSQLDETCSCGNKFMEDSAFCRKCGAPRGSKSDTLCECPLVNQLCNGGNRQLQAAISEASALLDKANRQVADKEADLKAKTSQHQKAVDAVNEAKRQLKNAEDRNLRAAEAAVKAQDVLAQTKGAFDKATGEYEAAEDAYKTHFLPLKGTVKETGNVPWAQSSKRHVDALTPILKAEKCEDCLQAGFVEAASRPPAERSSFCNTTVQEVEKILLKHISDKKNKVAAATPPFKDAQTKAKDANDAKERALANEKDAKKKLSSAEDAEGAAKIAKDNANDALLKSKDDVKYAEATRADKLKDLSEFKKLEKELRDAEDKVDDAIKTKAALDADKRGALDLKRSKEKDVDRARDGLTSAQSNCAKARAEAEKARAAADAAKAAYDRAVKASADFEDLYKKHFVPLKMGKFANIADVNAHLDALRPTMKSLDIEPSLLAGFEAASCHTKEERGPFCSRVVVLVDDCMVKYGQKLKNDAAALKGPYDKAEAEAKRLAALQEKACGEGVREAEKLLERRIAADDEAAKAVEKASKALEDCSQDLNAKVQFRNKKLEEVKKYISCTSGSA
eukprot:TRINITY_DN11803_c0_g2_i1.p1 TRINITY_DN11803_c0_g2~~TRINITY_DN11803_c0_g2_i1.p1  ORF type:complete len:620 (-),score=183.05 TRINITY_DN11803_c0_g2_i1:408-2198(-)